MKNTIYQFKVYSDKKTYRIIEIRENKSLYDFAKAITKSFDFYFDHCFGFYSDLKDIYNSEEAYKLFVDIPDCDSVLEHAKSVENSFIKDVFSPQKKMIFLFDYGDDWYFLVECINIIPAIPHTRYPNVTKKVGKAPKQYH